MLHFSAHDYSRFKFGCKDVARKFGYELAEKMCTLFTPQRGFIQDKQIVVCSSAYNFIPTATFAMKDYFVQHLNTWLVNNNMKVVQETKISRTVTYTEDYGSMNTEQREALLRDDENHIDREFVRGKLIIFLDDIRVTGSHERLMEKMITKYDLQCDWIFAYYARIVDDEMDPKFEDFLNYFYVKSLLHLDHIIKNENFLLNTRTVKYILKAPMEEFIPFISYQKSSLVQTIYHQAIGNGYHLVDIYKPNLEFIRNKLRIDGYFKN